MILPRVMAMDESNSSLRSTVARRNADDETLSFGRNSDNILSTRKTSPPSRLMDERAD
jgi:hypothetical protein